MHANRTDSGDVKDWWASCTTKLGEVKVCPDSNFFHSAPGLEDRVLSDVKRPSYDVGGGGGVGEELGGAEGA